MLSTKGTTVSKKDITPALKMMKMEVVMMVIMVAEETMMITIFTICYDCTGPVPHSFTDSLIISLQQACEAGVFISSPPPLFKPLLTDKETEAQRC